MRTVTVKIATGNAAFTDDGMGGHAETARILRDLADQFEGHSTATMARKGEGNRREGHQVRGPACVGSPQGCRHWRSLHVPDHGNGGSRRPDADA